MPNASSSLKLVLKYPNLAIVPLISGMRGYSWPLPNEAESAFWDLDGN